MSTRTPPADLSDELLSEFGANASYVADLLNRYKANPSAVDDEWRTYFQERFGFPSEPGTPSPAAAATPAPARPAPPAPPAPPVPVSTPPLPGERTALRGAAARIAENMQASLTVPTATTQRKIPIKLLDENRRLVNDVRATIGESKISFTHLVSSGRTPS
jgi:2-oxoglutarate dehydrogenase E1 component